MSAIDPVEFLEEAKSLAIEPQLSEDAVRRRTVVGRSYYAAYHACLAFAKKIGFDPLDRFNDCEDGKLNKKLGTHAYLISWLSSFNHASVKGIARELSRLKEFRCSADYDEPFSPPSVKDANHTIKKAEILITRQCPSALSMLLPSLVSKRLDS